jgi:hypothetical protein
VPTKSNSIYLLFTTLIALSLLACGKVTQTVTDKDPQHHFDLSFSVKVVSPIPIPGVDEVHIVTPSVKLGVDLNQDLIVSIIGITEDGRKKELSWGKGTVTQEPIKLPTPNTEMTPVVFSSTAINKSKRPILKSDHQWSNPKFDAKTFQWNVTATEIENTYHRYLIGTFTDINIYQIAFIDMDLVSNNPTISLGELSDYTTFISLLQIVYMEDTANGYLFDHTLHQKMITLFTPEFYAALNFKFPPNISPGFSEKNPSFSFEKTPIISALLNTFKLYVSDPNGALNFIVSLSETPAIINRQSQELLIQILKNPPDPPKP